MLMDLLTSVHQLKSAGEKEGFQIDLSCISQLDPGSEPYYDALSAIILEQVFDNHDNLKSLQRSLRSCVSCLQKHSTSILEKKLSDRIECAFSDTGRPFPFCALSFLLEDCTFSRGLLSPYFGDMLDKSHDVINCKSTLPQQADQAKIYEAIKVVIQVLKFMKKDVMNCFNSSFENPMLCRLLSIANNCLIMMQRCKLFSNLLRNMCAVLIGQLLNYESDDCTVARVICNLSGCDKKLKKFDKPGPLSELIISDSIYTSKEDKNAYVTVLLKGLFSCTRPSVFVIQLCDEDNSTFLQFSFQLLCQGLEMVGESQHHEFQVLKLWWTKACYLSRSQDAAFNYFIFATDSPFVRSTLDILFCNWDSSISGVTTTVLEIFAMLMKVHLSLFGNQKTTPLTEKLLDDFTELSSSAKGKYSFISTLLTLTKENCFVEKYPQFINKLIPSLGINHLCPAISKTYRTIVTLTVRYSSEEHCRIIWANYLAPDLIKALSHSDPVIRTNASLHWLPVHLKQVSDAFHKLSVAVTHYYSDNLGVDMDWIECKLLALTSIAKVARSENLISFDNVNGVLLEQALSSFCDSVRAEAFALVCCQSRTSEKISANEMTLLRQYLPLNMNSDSPTFRQHLVFCVKSFIERVRDSSAAFMKKSKSDKFREKPTGSHCVDSCEDILQFINDLCLRSLNICFTYQRKKTAIDIFSALCSVLIKKPGNSKFSKMLISDENRIVIFNMLSDTIPEIRSQSMMLLLKFFPPCVENCLESSKELATTFCRSPRAQDNESGAVIWQYLTFSNNSANNVDEHVKTLVEILDNFRKDFEVLKANILSASQKSPTHGWMLALTRCVDAFLGSHDQNEILNVNSVFEDISKLAINVIEFMLRLVFGKVSRDGNNDADRLGLSADFCEMTERIEKLTLDNGIEKPHHILLTEDHECILACCWLCVLRGSSLLSSVAAVIGRAQNNEKILSDICNTFVIILTSCRHRGALEGCFESFLNTCKVLFISADEKYSTIPASIMKRVIDSLHADVQTESNVTRRSAGIPLIIEAVLHAESLCKKGELFHSVIVNMISLALQVPHLQAQTDDDKFDYPQVHALYVLKHLFRNSQLGSQVLKYAVDVFKIAIDCSTSPLWVVRNAATHLFGAVANRMLGQKNIDTTPIQSAENSVSSVEFFSRHQGLDHFIIKELKLSLPDYKEALTRSNLKHVPSFPKSGCHSILSVLSKLAYRRLDSKNIPGELVRVVTKLLNCPVYSVRCLSANSLLGLMGVEAALKYTTDLIEKIPLCYGGQDFNIDSNSLHGHMVFVEMVTKRYARISVLDFIMGELLKRPWLWCFENIHPLISCTTLQIISSCLKHSVKYLDRFVRIATEQVSLLLDNNKLDVMQQAVADRYWSALIQMVLNLANDGERIRFIKKCLYSNCVIMQTPVLKWLQGTGRDSSPEEHIVGITIQFLSEAHRKPEIVQTTVLRPCIEIVINTPNLNPLLKNWRPIYEIGLGVLTSSSPLSLQCDGLKMLSNVLVHLLNLKRNDVDPEISFPEITTLWINHISSRTSHMKAPEPMRLSASQSLEIAGAEFLSHLLKSDTKEPQMVMIVGEKTLGDLISASLYLLHDEQPDIRKHTCAFVSRNTFCSYSEMHLLHQNMAAKKLLSFVFHNFSHLHDVLDAIFVTCFGLFSKNICESNQAVLFGKNPFNAYEEPLEMAYLTVQCFVDAMEKQKDNLEKFIQIHFTKTLPFMIECLRDSRANFVDGFCIVLYLKAIVCSQSEIFQSDNTQSLQITALLSSLQQNAKLNWKLKEEVECILFFINNQ